MIQSVINWFQAIGERVDEKTLVLVMIVISVVMAVCGVVAVMSLDRDNTEMRMILEGLLKEKRAAEEEKQAKMSDFSCQIWLSKNDVKINC